MAEDREESPHPEDEAGEEALTPLGSPPPKAQEGKEESPLSPEEWGFEGEESPEEDSQPSTYRPRVLHVVLGLLALAVLYLLYQWVTWPDVAALAETQPETTAFIERHVRKQGGPVQQTWVSYSRISPHLKRAILVSEDINFFDHDGFETDQIEEALEKAWKEKQIPRGASTVTQQLAKNLWLSPSKNPVRKIKEAILTRQLEEHLEKRRIFELYLNVVELGPGIYGAEAAARHWFGVSAASLSEYQAAQLAAALPRPKTWNPGSNSGAYRNRVRTILRRMGKAQWLWKVI